MTYFIYKIPTCQISSYQKLQDLWKIIKNLRNGNILTPHVLSAQRQEKLHSQSDKPENFCHRAFKYLRIPNNCQKLLCNSLLSMVEGSFKSRS